MQREEEAGVRGKIGKRPAVLADGMGGYSAGEVASSRGMSNRLWWFDSSTSIFSACIAPRTACQRWLLNSTVNTGRSCSAPTS